MSKEELQWVDTTNRFVAFFDIMGFKDIMIRNGHDYALNKVKTFKKAVDTLINGSEENFKMTTNLKSYRFSDSIFIFSKTDIPQDFDNLLHQCNILLKICFQYNIPLKGAISHGLVTADFDNSIFVGQPMIDAYVLHEDLQMFGAILDHNTENKLKEYSLLKDDTKIKLHSEVTQYKTPTKSGKINYYCIKWPFLAFPIQGGPSDYAFDLSDKKHIDNFYNTVSGKARLYVDNTIEFVNSLIDSEEKAHPGIKEFKFRK